MNNSSFLFLDCKKVIVPENIGSITKQLQRFFIGKSCFITEGGGEKEKTTLEVKVSNIFLIRKGSFLQIIINHKINDYVLLDIDQAGALGSNPVITPFSDGIVVKKINPGEESLEIRIQIKK